MKFLTCLPFLSRAINSVSSDLCDLRESFNITFATTLLILSTCAAGPFTVTIGADEVTSPQLKPSFSIGKPSATTCGSTTNSAVFSVSKYTRTVFGEISVTVKLVLPDAGSALS